MSGLTITRGDREYIDGLNAGVGTRAELTAHAELSNAKRNKDKVEKMKARLREKHEAKKKEQKKNEDQAKSLKQIVKEVKKSKSKKKNPQTKKRKKWQKKMRPTFTQINYGITPAEAASGAEFYDPEDGGGDLINKNIQHAGRKTRRRRKKKGKRKTKRRRKTKRKRNKKKRKTKRR